MELKRIIEEIKAKRPEVTSVISVGCGAPQAELYPAKYFLEGNAKELRTSLYATNEFVYVTPTCVSKESIIITCSLGGNTPETVRASKKATDMGAKVIAVIYTPGSPLANSIHYVVLHGFEKNYAAKLEKMTSCLQLAAEILNRYEGYEYCQDMMTGFAKIFDLIEDTVFFIVPSAKKFAGNYKDAPTIYVMSSGATHMVAYSFSICLLMEMQWISSGFFHGDGSFHGPFEIIDKDVSFLFLMNDGNTRALDSRTLDFLSHFQAKTTPIDAKDFGLGSVISSTVKDYFDLMPVTVVLQVYTEQLAILRNHPLTQRRYTWKLEC